MLLSLTQTKMMVSPQTDSIGNIKGLASTSSKRKSVEALVEFDYVMANFMQTSAR